MNISIKKAASIKPQTSIVLVGNNKSSFSGFKLSEKEQRFIKEQVGKNGKNGVVINQYNRFVIIHIVEGKTDFHKSIEKSRKEGNKLVDLISENKIEELAVIDVEGHPDHTLAFVEGLALGNYQFLKYFKDAKKKASPLKNIFVSGKSVKERDVEYLQIIMEATFAARTLVNEPVSFLTAVQLSKEMQKLGKEAGFRVEVLNKTKIESLKMGGLLAVNKGSKQPPTFNILEWAPKNSKNKKPFVFVGKGVVFDTGGFNIKTSGMEIMKCDMAGAAAVTGAIYAIAKAKLPFHVIALIPATDNRVDGDAYVPGDVVKMFDGTTVEVLNTDAEGRMILADALSYAKKYKPELVIDLATLTGAALRSIGTFGIAAMGNAGEKETSALKSSGLNVYERVAEMPFWDEYGEQMKSDIADLKNIGGGAFAGAMTAGKFLEHFTDYPWIHLDIAGPAFSQTKDSYRGKGGTGVGVRLLFDFLKNKM